MQVMPEAVQGAHGAQLHYQCWEPWDYSRKGVVALHGLGEHCGSLQGLASYLVPRGYYVFAPDLRGHGRSPGARGDIESWEVFRQDLDAFLLWIRENFLGVQLFLFGSGLGALVAMDYALFDPRGLKGVIACSPPLAERSISTLPWWLTRSLSESLPHLQMHARRRNGHTPPDPLRHDCWTPRLAVAARQALDHLNAHALAWRTPLLLIAGSQDARSPTDAGRELLSKMGTPDKELREIRGAGAHLWEDTHRDKVLRDMEVWMEYYLVMGS